MKRRHFLFLVVGALSGCKFITRGDTTRDDGSTGDYVDRRRRWAWVNDVYREITQEELDRFIDQMDQDQLGHGRIFTVTGSVVEPMLGPDGVYTFEGGMVTDVVCEACKKGHLVFNGQKQHFPWGRDNDGDDDGSSSVYAKFGQCNRCLSRRFLPESYDEKAPALKTQSVDGLGLVYPLPIGGFIFPFRFQLPALSSPAVLRPLIEAPILP